MTPDRTPFAARPRRAEGRRRATAPWAGLLALALAACKTGEEARFVKADMSRGDWSEASLKRLAAGMDPGAQALAWRHDPAVRAADAWGRPTGWASLDITEIPSLGLGRLSADTAREINDLRPASGLPRAPMRRFILRAGTADAREALKCLSQAVYYEAAREPLSGQQAVAQVVLNRVRHPAYPKSVCGVVFQGAARVTGCQFSFTCDGAMAWAPEPALWSRAQAVAKAALTGFVARDVGSATHYHADYVAPYWAPTLVKLNKVGAHIFYRWTGPAGEPAAFTGRYAGREAVLSPAILGGTDPRTQGLLSPERSGMGAGRKVTLALAGEVRTYTVVDPTAADGKKTRVLGTIMAPRRQPTPEEVKAINASLAKVEAQVEAPGEPAAATPEAAP